MDYEEIVRKYYKEALMNRFTRFLCHNYPKMRLEDAENIYQDTFCALHKIIHEGKADEVRNWESYIFFLGKRIAAKYMRHSLQTLSADGGDDGDYDGYEEQPPLTAAYVEQVYRRLYGDEDSFYTDTETIAVLSDEMSRTKEPCHSIVRLHYYERLSMATIAEMTGYKDADTVKAKKSQCMKSLSARVKAALQRAGLR